MIAFKLLQDKEPFNIFYSYYIDAKKHDQKNIEAACISSYSKELDEVNSRFVNIKYIEKNKFIFFTNYESPKSKEFNDCKKISMIFFWNNTNIQIRIKGTISPCNHEYNQKHFKTRTKEKNALAISSKQSQEILNYGKVKKNYYDALEIANLEECPNYWGGFQIEPFYFEFWKGNKNRLNKRISYNLNKNEWHKAILQP